MRNWLGQDIEVGSWVYRGGRRGSGSEFKAGKVKKMPEGKAPRVDWIFAPMSNGTKLYESRSAGNPTFESLVKLDDALSARLDIMNDAMLEFDEQVPPIEYDEFFTSRNVPHVQNSWGKSWDYGSSEYKRVREEYDLETGQRTAARNDFVNSRLVAAGLPPI